MRPARNRCPGEHHGRGGRGPQTLLDKVGLAGLLALVWRSTPIPLRLIAFPYGIIVYGRFLGACYSLEGLDGMHREKYHYSLMFRLLRPRYHKVRSLLARFEKDDGALLAN
jgi:hypothetical protein